MFLNLKISGNKLLKCVFIIILIIIFIILFIGIYNIFFRKIEKNGDDNFTLNNTLNTDKVSDISSSNYTNILKAVTDNLDHYVGCKVHFTGYVYRLLDFNSSQFVLARDMIVKQNPLQSLVVGFLCESKKACDFQDGEWVDVTGTIKKGDYYGEIAIIDVTDIFKCNEPENKYVSTPDDTYIPTNSLL